MNAKEMTGTGTSAEPKTIPLFGVFMAAEADKMVLDTLHSGTVAQGPLVNRFEDELRKFLCIGPSSANAERDIVTVNSGTSALDLAFALIGIEPGDVVVSTPMTCVATNIMLAHRRANILWADVDPVTGLIKPESVATIAASSLRPPKAIVTVDWAGDSCDYDAIRKAAPGVPIIEDAAHAFGATYNGKQVSSAGGNYVVWSFQAIKHLTTGDGGALGVPASELDRARRLRWFGYDRNTNVDFRALQDLPELGFKYHMNDIAASIGLANLPHMQRVVDMFKRNAVTSTKMLRGRIPDAALPLSRPESSWWLYTVRCERRSELVTHLKNLGITASPVHRRNDEYAGIRKFATWMVDHPGVNIFAATELAVPSGWWMGHADLQRVADGLASFKW